MRLFSPLDASSFRAQSSFCDSNMRRRALQAWAAQRRARGRGQRRQVRAINKRCGSNRVIILRNTLLALAPGISGSEDFN